MDKTALKKLGRIINELRVIEGELPASYAAVLIYVGRHITEHGEEPRLYEVADNVGIIRPSISRIILAMSERRLGGQRIGEERPAGARKALGLLKRIPDPTDLRMVKVGITPKGTGVLNRMVEHMTD